MLTPSRAVNMDESGWGTNWREEITRLHQYGSRLDIWRQSKRPHSIWINDGLELGKSDERGLTEGSGGRSDNNNEKSQSNGGEFARQNNAMEQTRRRQEEGNKIPSTESRASTFPLEAEQALGVSIASNDDRLEPQVGLASYGSRVAGASFMIGIPALSCIILALILCLVYRFCRGFKQFNKEKVNDNNGQSGTEVGGSKSSIFQLPVSFIPTGNLFDSLHGTASCERRKSDKNKLTLSMELADGDNKDDNVDDHEEQLRKQIVQSRAGQRKSSFAGNRSVSINITGLNNTKKSAGQRKTARLENGISIKGESCKHYGRLRYALNYDFTQSLFSVAILEAQNLPGMDLCGSSDPYVRVELLPDSSFREKTRIHRKTLNPVFNETFKFNVAYVELTRMTLQLSVYDFDRFSKHDEIGQVTIAMDSVDLAQTIEQWADLGRLSGGKESSGGQLGEICISLRYVPTAGKLTVIVLEARKLKKMDLAGLSDPYVKLALMSYGKRLMKKKTTIKKCTLNPHYNESFTFDVPFERTRDVQIAITVVDYDRIGTSEPIGKIVIGCESATGEAEQAHWRETLACPRRLIARWHSLKGIDFEQPAEPEHISLIVEEE